MGIIGDIDLFYMFRWMLATFCTIYVIIYTFKTLIGWLKYFQSSRETATMGRYATVLLLRLRFRRFTWELCQIAVLLIILCYVIYSHYTLGKAT
ncbi:MAG: hypothetical protein JSV03_14325 [Planctomycetota bacterium]|nr:MAG: hypothetical protein JSV03_14325 [Planctomycetota bacterium]